MTTLESISTIFLLSLACAVGGTMVGEVWSWIVEGYRVGTPHMSFSAQRLSWSRHPTTMFSGALVLFWLVAVKVAHQAKSTATPG